MRESTSGQEGEPVRGFSRDSDEVDIIRAGQKWQRAGDERLFKLILSPEFGERIDLKDLTRRLMGRVENDLGAPLEWVAVSHFNTEHPHVHVLLRGMAGGRNLVLARDYIKSGIRKHAEELCTAQLGYRSPGDLLEARRREVDQARFTSLDVLLRRHNTPTNADSAHPDYFLATVRQGDRLAEARMRVLQSMGLAEPANDGRWRVRTDFEHVLRSMKKVFDRQKMLASCSELVSDERLPVEFSPTWRIDYLEGRVLGHVLDDATGNVQMLLEGADSKVHVIPHESAIESLRMAGRLRPSAFVILSRTSGIANHGLEIQDLGDAEQYLATSHFTNSARQLIQRGALPNASDLNWGGWLGRYHARLQAEVTSTQVVHSISATSDGGRRITRSTVPTR